MKKRTAPRDVKKLISQSEVIEALKSSGGYISLAATALGCSQANISQRIKADPAIKEAYDEITETVIDQVENSLIKQAKLGEGWATCFYLKCKAKHRGYVERQEVTGADGGPVRFTVVYDDKPESPAET